MIADCDNCSDPNLAVWYLQFASIYADKEENQSAIKYFLKAINIGEANSENCNPHHRVLTYLQLAELQLESAQYEDCDKSVHRALELLSTAPRAPGNVVCEGKAFCLLAELCLVTRSLDQAREHGQKALQLSKDHRFYVCKARLAFSKIHDADHDMTAAITEVQMAVTHLKILGKLNYHDSILLNKCLAAHQKYRLTFLAENPRDTELASAHLTLAEMHKKNNNLFDTIKETDSALRTVKGVLKGRRRKRFSSCTSVN